MGADQDRAILRVGQQSVTLFAGPADYEGNGRPIDAGMAADGRLTVANLTAINGCAAGDTGSYDWSVSDGGQLLTLTLATDDCAPRGRFLAGDWIRSACLNPDNQCLGVVEPGTYPSQFFSPRVSLEDGWQADLGSLSYTVPAGWAASDDWPSTYGLAPADDYVAFWAEQSTDPVWPDAVIVWARPAAVTPDACSFTHAVGDGQTPAQLAEAVSSVPGVIATTPVPVEIGGRPDISIDVRIADGWTGTCPEISEGRPFVPLVAEAVEDGYRIGLGGQDPSVAGSDPQRLIFLDIGGGHIVMIQVDSLTEDTFEPFVAQAMPIIESFRFED